MGIKLPELPRIALVCTFFGGHDFFDGPKAGQKYCIHCGKVIGGK